MASAAPENGASDSNSNTAPNPPFTLDTMGATNVGEKGELLPLSAIRLVSLTIGLLGIQFCWAVQVGNATKTLLELGLSTRLVSYAWLAGPIAGIVVQPVVGAWSDRCTSRHGRRRPFLTAGTAITALCLFAFAYAKTTGELLGDNRAATVRPRALALAIVAFWALDFALNAAQGPLRALLADVVPETQHPTGNSYFALMTGLGNLAGSAAGAVRLRRAMPIFPDDLTALYALAAVAVTVTMAITVVFTEETPLEPSPRGAYAAIDDSDETAMAGGLRGLVRAWRSAPYPFHRVFAVQCATWFAWFTLYVFGTSWVGTAVYGGRAEASPGTLLRERYDAGVRAGNLGLALQSAVTVMVSLAIPRALLAAGTRTVYVGGHLVLAGALLCALWTRQRAVAVALLAATGLPWAITMAVPWSLMGRGVSKHAPGSEGVYFTLFNLSQCFPEVVVSVVSPLILRVANVQAAVLGVGGAVALAGGVAIIVLRIGMDDEEEFERLPIAE